MCPNDRQPMYISPIYNRSDQLFDNEEGSDVTFKVGVEPETWRFPGHSSVLRNNPVFKAMLAATPDNVITIPDVDGRAFDLLLRCIYNQEVKLQSVDTALYTLYAAQKYMCTSLMKRCLYYLDEHMSVNNVLQVYQHMRVHSGQRRTGGDPWEASAPPYHQVCRPQPHLQDDNFYAALGLHTSLTNNCLHYIDTHADQVMAQESIEDLSAECLRELVERDTLDVSSEVSVYWALERWSNRECKRRQLEMSPENRRSVLSEELLFAVRFLTMNKDQFYVGPLKGDLLTKQEITVLLGYILGHNSSSPSSAHCLLPVLSDRTLAYQKRKRVPPRHSGFEPLSGGRGDSCSCSRSEDSKQSSVLYCGAKIKKQKKNRKKKTPTGEGDSPPTRRRCTGSCVADCVFRALACLFD